MDRSRWTEFDTHEVRILELALQAIYPSIEPTASTHRDLMTEVTVSLKERERDSPAVVFHRARCDYPTCQADSIGPLLMSNGSVRNLCQQHQIEARQAELAAFEKARNGSA